jgi:hypothetical protein
MQTENPTQSGDSIQERLESLLSADEPQEVTEAPQEEPTSEADPAEVEAEVETADDEGDEGNEPSLSLTDLAKYLGVDESALDVDEAGQLNLKTKVDGTEGKAKLTDLLTSYQLRGHLDNQTRAVAEQQKALAQQAAQQEAQVQARVQQVMDLASAAQAELNREFQNVDWQTLRVTDPAEYAASIQDYQARQAHINNIANNAAQQRQQYEAQQQHHQAETLKAEAQALPTLIPEWKDPVVADKERAEIKDWAINLGIPKEEVDQVSKASYVAVLRKAMMFDRMQSSKAAVEKKVHAAPRLVKPGQTQPANSQETNLRSIKAQIKQSGGKQGITDYLLASGKV